MTASNTEIVVAYDELGLSPDEIAIELNYELAAVKAILLANSKKYKKSVAASAARVSDSPHTDDISEEEFDQINAAYKNIALYSDNDTVREKALSKLRDEYRGRLPSQVNEQAKALQAVNVNILELNETMKQAKQLKQLLVIKQLGIQDSMAGQRENSISVGRENSTSVAVEAELVS